MGLDMYAYTTATPLPSEVDFADPPDFHRIHYWRKHPDLHGWMQRLYFKKGGAADSFNCVNLALSAHDLDNLESDIRNRCLPDTSGFFFGDSDGSETEDDLAFIAQARAALARGLTVFYCSWW